MKSSNVFDYFMNTFKSRWAWLSVPAFSILQREKAARRSLWPRPSVATWYVPAPYLNQGDGGRGGSSRSRPFMGRHI